MKHKSFSIVKACEYAFDSFIHHPHIFFQLILLIGVPTWVFTVVKKRYLNPAIEYGYMHAKERLLEMEVAKQLGIDRKAFNERLKYFEEFYKTQIITRKEAIKPGVEYTTTIVSSVAPGIVKAPEHVSAVGPYLPAEESGKAILMALLAALVSLALLSFFTIFSMRLVLDFYDFHTVNIPRAIHVGFQLLLTAALAWILYEVVISIGFFLLIIPGIILALRYCFVQELLADGKASTVGHAFKLSAMCTDNAKWKLLFAGIVSAGIASFAMYEGWVTLLATPVLALAWIYIYRNLLEQSPEALKDGLHNFA